MTRTVNVTPIKLVSIALPITFLACGGGPSAELPGPCTAELAQGVQGENATTSRMEYVYNDLGYLTDRLEYQGDDLVRQVELYYDGNWKLRIVELYEMPEHTRRSRFIYRYFDSGLLESIELELGERGRLAKVSRFQYGDQGQLQIRQEEITDELLQPSPQVTRFAYIYDDGGRLIAERPMQEDGIEREYVYVDNGVLRHRDSGTSRTLYDIDAHGNILAESAVSLTDETVVRRQWLYTYGCWTDADDAARSAPAANTPFLSADVR